MEEEKKKKAWTTPKLTSLVRRKPEEGILSACKTGETSPGPTGAQQGCVRAGELEKCDSACYDVGAT